MIKQMRGPNKGSFFFILLFTSTRNRSIINSREHKQKLLRGVLQMKNFKVIQKSEFEMELQAIISGLGLPISGIQDITEALNNKGYGTKERIYKIKTNQSNKCIIIYSSVDIRTDKTRSKGSDALRVVVWLRTNQGDFFKSYKKHYRLETIFKNLGNTIKEINSNKISSFKGFKKELKYA
jgi:hypothetical protein